jgi:hypothetical protein
MIGNFLFRESYEDVPNDAPPPFWQEDLMFDGAGGLRRRAFFLSFFLSSISIDQPPASLSHMVLC